MTEVVADLRTVSAVLNSAVHGQNIEAEETQSALELGTLCCLGWKAVTDQRRSHGRTWLATFDDRSHRLAKMVKQQACLARGGNRLRHPPREPSATCFGSNRTAAPMRKKE